MSKARRLREGGRRVRPEDREAGTRYEPPTLNTNPHTSYDHTQPWLYRSHWLVKR